MISPETSEQVSWLMREVVTKGTGKFANASGGGTFTSLTNPETGESKLDVLGSATLN